MTAAKRILRVYWRRGKQHLGSACEVHLGEALMGDNIQREAIRMVMKPSVRKEGFKGRLYCGREGPGGQFRIPVLGGLLHDGEDLSLE